LNMYPCRHVQIILRLYKSPAEVLFGFDIDSCTVGYDGQRVWMMERGRRALTKGYNLVNMSRRSLTYEVRLFKYSKRGFCTAVPNLDKSRVDPALFQKNLREVQGLAKLLLYDYRAQNMPAVVGKAKRGENGEDLSDYSELNIPWGPGWYTASIVALLNQKDKSQFFARRNIEAKDQSSAEQGPKKHKHIFITGIDEAIGGSSSFWCKVCQRRLYLDDSDETGKFVKRPIEWVKRNPAYQDYDNGFRRSLMTGSFHPVVDENWEKGVYLSGSQSMAGPLLSTVQGVGDIEPKKQKEKKLAKQITAKEEERRGKFRKDSPKKGAAKKRLKTSTEAPSLPLFGTSSPANAFPSFNFPPPAIGASNFSFGFGTSPVKSKVSTEDEVKEGSFECAVCNKRFFSENQKRKHVRETGHIQSLPSTVPPVSGSLFLGDTTTTSPSIFGPQPGAVPTFFTPPQSQVVEESPKSPNWQAIQAGEQTKLSPSGFNIPFQPPTTATTPTSRFGPQPTGMPIVGLTPQQKTLVLGQTQKGEQPAARSTTTKLLLLVALCFKEGAITADEKGKLKDLIISGSELVFSSMEVFEIDQDLDELVDTFKRICRLVN